MSANPEDDDRPIKFGSKYEAIGALSLSRFHGSDEGFRLVLMDEVSRTTVVEVEFTADQLPNLIAGAGTPAECRFQTGNFDLVGWKAEHKSEVVFVPRALERLPDYRVDPQGKLVRQCLAPFEREGWKADLSDLTNHHHKLQGKEREAIQAAVRVDMSDLEGGLQSVTFRRFVHPKTGQPFERPKR